MKTDSWALPVVRLERRGSDNPRCPVCGGYNAMLFQNDYEGRTVEGYFYRCRDCGFECASKGE